DCAKPIRIKAKLAIATQARRDFIDYGLHRIGKAGLFLKEWAAESLLSGEDQPPIFAQSFLCSHLLQVDYPSFLIPR
ncbi:MAG: hypothetical protein WBN92_08680, partial [Terriglobia bacterium]